MDQRLPYRLLTGRDDAEFCRRVSRPSPTATGCTAARRIDLRRRARRRRPGRRPRERLRRAERCRYELRRRRHPAGGVCRRDRRARRCPRRRAHPGRVGLCRRPGPVRRRSARSSSSSGSASPPARSTTASSTSCGASGSTTGRPVLPLPLRRPVPRPRPRRPPRRAWGRHTTSLDGFEGPRGPQRPPGRRRLEERRPAVAAGLSRWPTPVRTAPGLRPDTLAVRGGLARSGFDETSEALFLTSGFVYGTAEPRPRRPSPRRSTGSSTAATATRRSRCSRSGCGCSRAPQACFATASGMSAVFVALAALCGQGVAGRRLAGAVRVLLRHPRRDPPALGRRDGLRRRARPRPVGARRSTGRRPRCSSRRRATRCRSSSTSRPSPSWPTRPAPSVVVDNVFGTPVFSRPLEHGADIVVYSATKHIDGQGRALGGAVLGPREFVDGPVKNLMRHTGPAMSPFNAWVMHQGPGDAVAAGGADGVRARSRSPGTSRARRGSAGSSTRGWSPTRSTSWPGGRCSAAGPSSRRHRRRQGRGVRRC